MTQRSARTHRRPVAASRAAAPIPGQPAEREDLLTTVLGATRSRWWTCHRAEIDQLRTHAEAKQAAFLPPGTTHARVAPGDVHRLAAYLAALPSATLPCSIDCRIQGAATPTWLRLTVLTRTGPVRARCYTGIVTDISPLKQLEDELLQISEREQNRIGQDLHDDLCQVLAGLSCLTRVLENRLAPQLPHEVDNLREINRQLVDAMDRTRALTHGLYPAKMRSGDARPALQELAKQVAVRFGVKVSTGFRGHFPAHAAQEILHVYRIAQEAISNAIRHGRADQIQLTLERKGEAMCLRVQDNGTGFPSSSAPIQGIGLQIMRHRADQLGAKIQIGNAPHRGALVVLCYQPLALL